MSRSSGESDPSHTSPQAVEETISTYDSYATIYEQQFADVDFGTYFTDFLAMVPVGAAVLDAGCGTGRDLAALVGRGIPAIGLDRSEGMLSVARRAAPQARLILGDLRYLPFGDSTLGGVWHCASLIHLSSGDAQRALTEVRRVLLPSAPLFLSVANGSGPEWRTTTSGRRWFYYYEGSEVARLAQEAGLELVSLAVEPGVTHGTWTNVLARKVE